MLSLDEEIAQKQLDALHNFFFTRKNMEQINLNARCKLTVYI